ncbi:TonB-dependent receptor domain-containing protein [Citromicrobium sp. WPS32]|uniref:TonB-dependent receptor domain-containing protein n=1 Tax=Citromicrobium sp. WPS32 TaxID=1634517 RepID=UPI0006C9033B|nr:TonB-dependent receptor [Citromicrobium sp. WPS32]KPM15903.1 TonB-dependent receptor [Citromicrobium sp. WPS32]MAY77165.1 TonB-dependent receptor [Citromicrobium sp.]|tara:strand:+ start:2713 stop:5502 length:2790 start_codon:yes stop_codon:yes gene_type:complete
MSTGKQLAGLLLLSTALTFPGVAFAQGTGTAQSGNAAAQPAVETPAEEPINPDENDAVQEGEGEIDVSVPGGNVITVTGRRGPRDITRGSSQVVSVLSTEDIARTGEGDIAGALSRVTGLSNTGNGRVFVRGLGDRYSLALLNGLPLPSPEPLSRVVPLDIFPTDIIASSLVQKTYSANFPGEFGGGVINLTTQAIPDESFLKVSFGVSGDTETTFENGLLYYGSDMDWYGFDGGRRDPQPALQAYLDGTVELEELPLADRQTIASTLSVPNLIVLQKADKLRPNMSGGLTGGTSFFVGDDAELGIIATANLSNSLRNRNVLSQTPVRQETVTPADDFRRFVTDNRILLNGLLGFGLEYGDQKIRWTNVYIRDVLKQASLSQGRIIVGSGDDGFDKLIQQNGWFERQLIDSQVVGEFQLGNDISLDLRGGYAQTDRESPYEYRFDYVRTNNPNDPFGDYFVNPLDNNLPGGQAAVAFSDLTEKVYYGGGDLTVPVMPDVLSLTAGAAYTDTQRYSERRAFQFTAPSNFPNGIALLRPDLLIAPAIIEASNVPGFAAPGVSAPVDLRELTEDTPAFDARLKVMAGYLKGNLTPIEGLTIDAGVRYEDGKQTVAPAQVFTNQPNLGAVTAIENSYWLPSATITYEFDNGLQLRASASKTIARPQFRELLLQEYTDPESLRSFVGNPALQDSTLFNAEVRGEYYFGQGSRVSLAGFYKSIDNPIEAFSQFTDNSQSTSFANAPKAELYGAEAELVWNYDLYDLGGFFESKRALLIANYTYTQSQIQVKPGDQTFIFITGVGASPRDATSLFRDGDPLTGQSDHLANIQVGFEDIDRLSQVTLLFSYASNRVTSRLGQNAGGLPDVIEKPGARLDLVIRQGVELGGVPLELKFEARNLTGTDNYEYVANESGRVDVNSYQVGQSFALSLSAEF